jgi:hypothetical protein
MSYYACAIAKMKHFKGNLGVVVYRKTPRKEIKSNIYRLSIPVTYTPNAKVPCASAKVPDCSVRNQSKVLHVWTTEA